MEEYLNDIEVKYSILLEEYNKVIERENK